LQAYALAGPFVGLRLHPTASGDAEERKEEWRRWDFGITFGGGLALRAREITIFAEAAYAAWSTSTAVPTSSTRAAICGSAEAFRCPCAEVPR